MFSVGDQIVHPMHGAGSITDIVERKINDGVERYYALKLTLGDVVLFVPVRSSEEIGLRLICSREQAAMLLEHLPEVDLDAQQSWNRRYRENMLRIRSGDAEEVAKVVKNLVQRDTERGLSTGEKKMLGSAKQILISELSLALNISPAIVEEMLNKQLCL